MKEVDPNGSPWPAHRPSRRGAILSATASAAARRGVAGLTVADVAAEAGMTPAAIYYHFPSKDDLLAEVVRATGAALIDALTAGIGRVEGRAQLAAALDAAEGWTASNRDLARLLWVDAVGAGPIVEAARRDTIAAIVEIARRVVAAARPGIDPVEAGVVALAFVSLHLASMELRFGAPASPLLPPPKPAVLRRATAQVGSRILP